MVPAFVWQNTITLGSVILGIIVTLFAIGGVIYAITRKGRIDELNKTLLICQGAADSWHEERDAAVAKADRLFADAARLTNELASAKVAHAQEMAAFSEQQREIRHGLKEELATLRLKTDQTIVLDGQKRIEQGFLQALERMDERSAKRDQAMFATQREITELLKELTSRVTREVAEKVGEVVQEKVDEINEPKRKP